MAVTHTKVPTTPVNSLAVALVIGPHEPISIAAPAEDSSDLPRLAHLRRYPVSLLVLVHESKSQLSANLKFLTLRSQLSSPTPLLSMTNTALLKKVLIRPCGLCGI